MSGAVRVGAAAGRRGKRVNQLARFFAVDALSVVDEVDLPSPLTSARDTTTNEKEMNNAERSPA